MLSHARIAEATNDARRKRKERDSSDSSLTQSPAVAAPEPSHARIGPSPIPVPGPVRAGNNRLLAGCLAHEFLTGGTLLGKRWGKETGAGSELDKAASSGESTRGREAPSSYAAVTYLLKAEAACIPGVVNPTQLAHWLDN
ncbi:uncharacterized protein LOC122016355 [Zingiber officinale]|uniref:Uncharacterized protein n=1 Tax=Zingiber officinale TaxID=94328 RepID=A0A8J5F7F9_ZINOF|nr:uncharacterized protein LOC122016355 [Zingiber officinale]KAG6480718.1 hypothetical protein ZIOFF_057303 [Zingiber officinale]